MPARPAFTYLPVAFNVIDGVSKLHFIQDGNIEWKRNLKFNIIIHLILPLFHLCMMEYK